MIHNHYFGMIPNMKYFLFVVFKKIYFTQRHKNQASKLSDCCSNPLKPINLEIQ